MNKLKKQAWHASCATTVSTDKISDQAGDEMRGAFDFFAGRISAHLSSLRPLLNTILRCEGISMQKHCDATPSASKSLLRGITRDITFMMAQRSALLTPSFVLEIMHATG